MAAPGSRAVQPALRAGSLLAGRYRVADRLSPSEGDPPEAARWRAVDEVLARPVDVLVVPADGESAVDGRALLDAAATAGTVSSPVPAQVYDAALQAVPADLDGGQGAGEVDVAYVVSEAVRGRRLAQVLAEDGPLEPEVARALVEQAALGLRAAHARGVAHGALHPGTLVVADAGGARLLDTAVGAVLSRDSRAAPPDPGDDVTALVGCLYAALTGRWPDRELPGPSGGLPPAPRVGSRTCRPHQVRAGVPRGLDEVVARGLGGDRLRTADQLLAALDRAAALDAAARPPAPRRRSGRTRVPLALAALLLGAGGLTGWAVTGLPDPAPQVQEQRRGSPLPPVAGAPREVDLTADGVTLSAFDPPPGDGAERDGGVPDAVDGDTATAWQSERYDTDRFGGLKPGVGLLVDLGQPVAVGEVEVALRSGTDVELRAGDAAPASADELPVVASVEGSRGLARLAPDAPVTARWLLVWVTRLPPDDGRFRAAVSELSVARE